ncbi:MAG: hypothetical protein ABF651_05670 [Sporolactobacillus sp.]
MLRYIYLAAISCYMCSELFPKLHLLNKGVSVLCLAAVLLSLCRARGLALFFGSFFLVSGSLLLALSGAKPASYVWSFGEMIQMVTLFALVPILSLPVRYGNYTEELTAIIQNTIRNEKQLYGLTSLIAYFFSSFMNLAALPMTYYAIERSVLQAPIKNKRRFLSQSITHGYAMPLLWSPITPIVGTVLLLTGTRYSRLLPLLISLSLAGLFIDWITFSLFRRKKAFAAESAAALQMPQSQMHGAHPWRLLHVLLATLLLNALVTLLDHFISLSFLLLVSFIVIPFSYIWCLLIRQSRAFFIGIREHFRTYPNKMSNQFFIFLSAGFFMTTLHTSRADDQITGWVSLLIGFTGFRIFLILLPLIPFSLAFLGLHPAIGLALIAGALHAELLSRAPLVVTIAMLGGAIPAFLMGPYNATLGMMGGLIDERPLMLSKWNWPFTAVYLIFLTLFVQLLYAALPQI